MDTTQSDNLHVYRHLFSAILLATVAMTFSGCQQLVEIPNTAGLERSAGEAILTDACLHIGNISEVHSADVPAGFIISQTPAAGTCVVIYTSVNLLVSIGPEPAVVPDVGGMDQTAAEAAIVGASLTVGMITREYSATAPTNTVISQEPAAGTSQAPGAPVNLVISKGPEPVLVPDVHDLPTAEAEAAITGIGLAVGAVTEEYSSTTAAGSVIRQEPAASASVPPQTAVNLVISMGPQPVTVPDVVGMPQAAAETAITSALLAMGAVTQAYSATIAVDNVISQDPLAGTSVVIGSSVSLIVSRGPEFVEVPDIVGMQQEPAEASLHTALLSMGAVIQVYNPDVPVGEIVSQSPEPGLTVGQWTAVSVEVSSEQPICIDSIDALQRIGNDPLYPLDIEYALCSDIDATSTAEWNDGAGFVPIGTKDEPFTGTLDGQKHTIYGLTIDLIDVGSPATGLISYLRGTVKNLTLKDCYVTGLGDTGALVGRCAGIGRVIRCVAQGTVTGSFVNVGGLIGWNLGAVASCSASGSVSGYHTVGGVVGLNEGTVQTSGATCEMLAVGAVGGFAGDNQGILKRCFATGKVTAYLRGERTYGAGGLVAVSDGTIEECYATGDVTAGANAGGLAGVSRGTILNSYAHGSVTSETWPGGLVGTNVGAITNCYATGFLSGVAAGGVTGIGGAAGSYWNTQSTGTVSSSGGTGKVTAEMMTAGIYAGWDFTSVWAIIEGQSYPYLQQMATGNLTVNIEPAEAVSAGAAWGVDEGDPWCGSGNTLTRVTPGIVTICFVPLEGWVIQSHSVKIVPGDTAVVNATYARYITVPDIAGQTQTDAETLLTATELAVGEITEEYSQTVPAGTVVSQYPAAGESVLTGTLVNLVVSQGTPPLQVTSFDVLRQIGKDPAYPLDGRYALAQDIEAPAGNFEPIGSIATPFTGWFDGQGHEITNLTITVAEVSGAGLFGAIGSTGTVKRLSIQGDVVAQGESAGGLLAGKSWGTVLKCRATGSVTTASGSAGGLIGSNYGTITQCCADCPVLSTNANGGGLAGFNQGIVTNCFALGAVTAFNCPGGLLGSNWGTVSMCFSAGTVSGGNGGGFAGGAGMGPITFSYWDVTTSGMTYSEGGIGQTTAALQSAFTFYSWDFSTIWDIEEGEGYPFLRAFADFTK